MCKKAVVGENIENNDAENKGIKDYSFSIFNLHISSVWAGIGIIIVLEKMYKLIRHSNTKTEVGSSAASFPVAANPGAI